MAATILVADDSATIRIIVQSALSGAGWQVLLAGNGKEALDCLKANPSVDLVISDWNMPVMGGLELIQGLRELPNYDDVPVLVLTTEDDGDSKAAARDLGVCGWVHKPVDPQVLVELVAELLNEQLGA